MSDCRKITTSKIIPLKDKGAKSTMIFDNPNQKEAIVVKVDGCAIKDLKALKCDFLVVCETEHFVELKGKNIKHACDQLEATIIKLSVDPKSLSKYCFVVSSRCPLTTTEVQKQKLKFKKKYNAQLTIKNSVCKHRI